MSYRVRRSILVWCCTALTPAAAPHFKFGVARLARGSHALHVFIPDTTDTAAITARDQAIQAFQRALPYFVWDGGLLTDELTFPLHGFRRKSDLPVDAELGRFLSADPWRRLNSKDVRILPERRTRYGPDTLGSERPFREDNLDEGYLGLQGARAILRTELAQLDTIKSTRAASSSVQVWQGEIYALEGYAEIMLADLYCSGVPLNTFRPLPGIGVNGDLWGNRGKMKGVEDAHAIIYQPSSTTAQVYHSALAKFDTALTFASDSARILNLARVGKGRAWLALGQYDSAVVAVAAVPQGYTYSLTFQWNLDFDWEEIEATVADREGRNGFPFVFSGDPRTETEWMSTDKVIRQVRMPTKYWRGGDFLTAGALGGEIAGGHFSPSLVAAPFTLANWEEAVLIRAEAALHQTHNHGKHASDQTWLHLLNELRATAPIPGTTQPNPERLVPLRDPGTDHGRIALLFAERANWLFLTGHRQGDLRRLVRQYHWPQDQVYPSGPYVVPQGLVAQVGRYGTDVNLPIPPEERTNPYFHGCLNRGA